MALSAVLRKSILSKDLCLKSVYRPCSGYILQNVNNVAKYTFVISRHRQVNLFQQVKKFSTTRQLLSSHGGDHSTLWTVERVVTIALMGFIPACIAMPSKVLDTATAVLVTMHMHWGLQAITSDYIRKAVFGPAIPKVTAVLVYVLSVVTLAGLLNLTFNQAGIGNSVQYFWRLS